MYKNPDSFQINSVSINDNESTVKITTAERLALVHEHFTILHGTNLAHQPSIGKRKVAQEKDTKQETTIL